jgi:hypothetical protein
LTPLLTTVEGLKSNLGRWPHDIAAHWGRSQVGKEREQFSHETWLHENARIPENASYQSVVRMSLGAFLHSHHLLIGAFIRDSCATHGSGQAVLDVTHSLMLQKTSVMALHEAAVVTPDFIQNAAP